MNEISTKLDLINGYLQAQSETCARDFMDFADRYYVTHESG